MKTTGLLFIILTILLSFSCKRVAVKNDKENKDTLKNVVQKKEKKISSDYLLMATLWYQKSAEMRAIYYQTYNFAKTILLNKLPYADTLKRKAVVVDIDETVLDNSPFEAHCITSNTKYSKKEWEAWVNKASAKALPGAVDFLNYAKYKDVETFYISNRRINLKVKTMENLKNLGFPFVDDEHIILRDSVGTKRYRRAKVLKNYDVLLYIGDNLTDFSEIYENRDSLLAKNIVDKNINTFGKDFLILPNPMYGEWEKPVFNNNMKMSDEKKDSLRKAMLDSY